MTFENALRSGRYEMDNDGLRMAGANGWLANFPRLSGSRFGLRDGMDALAKVRADGSIAIVVSNVDGRLEFVDGCVEIELELSVDSHWTELLAACDEQHGVDVTNRFFSR